MIPPLLYLPILIFLGIGLIVGGLSYFILSFKLTRAKNGAISTVCGIIAFCLATNFVIKSPGEIYSGKSYFWTGIRNSSSFKEKLKKAQQGVSLPRRERGDGPVSFQKLGPYVQQLGEMFLASKENVGLVVGVVCSGEQNVWCFGSTKKAHGSILDENTIFEVGGVTQFFTGLLLAQMHVKGELDFHDYLASLMPSSASITDRSETKLRLIDLATHTSGVSSDPDSAWSFLSFLIDPRHPCKRFTEKEMYAFLKKAPVSGKRFISSDIEFMLLGNLLEKKSGKNYEELLDSYICKPLAMNSTRVTLDKSLKSRLAEGHDFGSKVSYSEVDPHAAGAGGIKSSAHDFLLLLTACVDGVSENSEAWSSSVGIITGTRRPTQNRGLSTGFGCYINRNRQGNDMIWNIGETEGFRSFMGMIPNNRLGVVVLSNSTRHLNYSHVEDLFVQDNRVEMIGKRILNLLSSKKESEEN